ncbi:hypothetical protein ACFC5Z_34905, partial [Streptomyces sp. NPDC056004]
SWTAPLDALRLAPGDDAATVTAGQMRELVERPEIVFAFWAAASAWSARGSDVADHATCGAAVAP